jgi:hypothetical protein
LRRLSARALSARCVSGVDGMPIRALSTGETLRLFLRTVVVSVGVAGGVVVLMLLIVESLLMVESRFIVESLVVGAIVLSPCWLCVGVGAGAPVPS